MGEYFDGVTLEEAKAWLRERVDKGEKCPCCTQYTRVYARNINKRMVQAMLNLYMHGGTSEFGHLPDMDPSKGDAAKLVYWGLIEEENLQREDGGRAGWWRVTTYGESFLKGHVRLPKYARIFDGRLLGLDGTETVMVDDCWGELFDLRKLMDP